MCVLTYMPNPEEKGFILTNNRDEDPERPAAIPPKAYRLGGMDVVFPKDPRGKGTWIATCKEMSLVLLNGGEKKHESKPPYRQSRGMVILDYFKFKEPELFFSKYRFEGMEPFTLLVFPHAQGSQYITQIQRSENETSLDSFPKSIARIWSSSTLYSPETKAKREAWFRQFLKENQSPNGELLKAFHLTAGEGDPENDLKMQRGSWVKTLSISQIIVKSEQSQLFFESL